MPIFAGKRKKLPPKKTIRANSQNRMIFGNLTPTPGNAQSPKDFYCHSGISSEIDRLIFLIFFAKLNSGDGLIDEYLEDVSNNIVPSNHETNNNVDLSVRGEQRPQSQKSKRLANHRSPPILTGYQDYQHLVQPQNQ